MPKTWSTPNHVCTTLPRAARATTTSGRAPTPVDKQEDMIRKRTKSSDRKQRQFWQKCILEIRRWKRRWR